MYQKLSLLLLAVTGDSRESWQERFDVTRPSCFFSFTLPTVFSARAAKTQTKQHCTSRRQTYVLEESVSWHSPCARVCVCVWSLPSIEQPGVCYMERRKPNFFFFQRAKKQMVRAKPEASVEAKDPNTGPAEKLKDEPVLWLQPDNRAHFYLVFGRR